MDDPLTLMNKAEAAKLARTTAGTIDRHIRAGNGPIVTKVGGRVFFQRDDIIAWVNTGRLRPPQRA